MSERATTRCIRPQTEQNADVPISTVSDLYGFAPDQLVCVVQLGTAVTASIVQRR